MKRVYKCSYHEDRLAIYALDQSVRPEHRHELRQLLFPSHVFIKRPGVAECVVRHRCARHQTITIYTFPVVTWGGKRGLPTLVKLNHSGLHQLPRAIIHKPGWNN